MLFNYTAIVLEKQGNEGRIAHYIFSTATALIQGAGEAWIAKLKAGSVTE
jgi:hypothetical protein